MPITAFFDVPGMSAKQYDQTIAALEAKGLGAPDGRLYHVAWSTPDGWCVLDVWESEEKLGQFAEALVPIILGIGATPPKPQIYPAYNIIEGS